MKRYAVRMNIAVSRAFGALRLVVPRREVEKDKILWRLLSASNFQGAPLSSGQMTA